MVLYVVRHFVCRCLHERTRLRFFHLFTLVASSLRQQVRSKADFAHPCFESFVPLLYEQLLTCLTQATSLTSCDVSYMRALVDSMWTRFGIVSPTLIQQMWTHVDPCGPNVDSMWTRFGIAFRTRFHDLKQDIAKKNFHHMWTRCGLDVDSLLLIWGRAWFCTLFATSCADAYLNERVCASSICLTW